MAPPLASWNDTPTRQAIVDFVERVTNQSGPDYVPPGYLPMIDLLDYLEASGFTNYIASGGDRDFMRPVTDDIYRIPAERVIGSSNALAYTDDDHGGSISYLASPDVFDDGPVKPVRIWSRHRQATNHRRRQLQRRHPDAPLRRREGPPRTSPTSSPRRRRP